MLVKENRLNVALIISKLSPKDLNLRLIQV